MLTRLINVFRRRRVLDELDEEYRLHLQEAVEQGRDPEEVRRAFGPLLRTREQSQDAKLAGWLDSLRADVVFAWRLLVKNRAVTLAAVLSLALTIGATTAAFRLIDALLLRPLPVAGADRLYALAYPFVDQNGRRDVGMSFDYPAFREMRAAVKGDAELIAVSGNGRVDLTHGASGEIEKASRQQVSGWLFPAFGLKPAAGRLFDERDDVTPGGHPVAVLSHDYWRRRFASDPNVPGRTFRLGETLYEIVGVAPEGFTGTETGQFTELFTPTMMNQRAITDPSWGWIGVLVQVKPGVSSEVLRQKLAAVFRQGRLEKVKQWKNVGRKRIDDYVNAGLELEPAASGASGFQRRYRQPLLVIGALAVLLLLIACANVANLMIAQAASRAKEMALRVSIGAGRARLMQLVLVESALLALAATALGALCAWWSAPLVVRLIDPAGESVRLHLPFDLRVLAFCCAITAAVVCLFGLAPAIRASSVKPVEALRGGDPHGRRRLMHALVAAQVAFCFLVHFVAGLFVASFDRLSHQPTGFEADRLLALETVSLADQPVSAWEQVAGHLRSQNGVENVALAGFALMSGNGLTGGVRVAGTAEWDAQPPYFLAVSAEWLETMRIPLLAGRHFRPGDAQPRVAIVNQAFARRYFNGENPVGRRYEVGRPGDRMEQVEIVGLAADARYRDMREAIRPTAYLPFGGLNNHDQVKMYDWATILVKTRMPDATALARSLRAEVTRARSELRVSDVSTQQELIDQHTVRERLLAMLALFFAVVALVLAGVGLYGVLHYTVLARRREIGIRLALGAAPVAVARRVTAEVFGMLLLGAGAGLALGFAAESYLEKLLFQVKGTDPAMVALPWVTLLAGALIAAVPPVLQAVRVDPARVLRAE